MTKMIVRMLELSPYFVPLFIMLQGILFMSVSYENLEATKTMINVGWVFLLGGESYLGVSIVQHYYNKAQQSFTNVEVEK